MSSWTSDRKRLIYGIAVLVAAVLGLAALWVAVSPVVAIVALGVGALSELPKYSEKVVLVAGGGLVGIVALLGFDVVGRLVGFQPPIWVGLALAIPVFAAAAFFSMHWGFTLQSGLPARWSLAASLVIAVVFVVLVPLWKGEREGNDTHAQVPVPQKIDVLLVLAAATQPLEVAPPPLATQGYDVHYWLGFKQGETVVWTRTNETDPGRVFDAAEAGPTTTVNTGPPKGLRPDASAVMVLDIDAGDHPAAYPTPVDAVKHVPRELASWRHMAKAVLPDNQANTYNNTPIYPLIQSDGFRPKKYWQNFSPLGPAAVPMPTYGATSIVDTAIRLAIGGAKDTRDLQLARQFRPKLLFDGGEEVPRPLSVRDLFDDRQIKLCDDTGNETCETVTDTRKLVNHRTHLQIKAQREDMLRSEARDPTDEGGKSAIYVHPVDEEHNGQRYLYLDYWWYLPSNPARTGLGGFCGAGFVIPGLTCFDHQSDWEGVTVVLNVTEQGSKTTPQTTPVGVIYAEHEARVRFAWSDLQTAWGAAGSDESGPLVYVARGTHASYPLRCRSDCHQLARDVGENPHSGTLPWVGNRREQCGTEPCVQLLPTIGSGRQPSLWNGYIGAWGDRRCFLGRYCDSGTPPTAPGAQGRFIDPTAYTGYGTLKHGNITFHRGAARLAPTQG